MKVLSTVEGTSALYPDSTLKAGLLPFKDAKADDTFYADISDFINAGNTTPFIYSGWENTIVNTGTKMQEFMQDKASIKDVADQLDEDQDSVVNNQPEVITTATEEISQESCAKLVGRCFAEATGSDVALISLGTWISGNGTNQNNDGVSGKLYAKNITDYDICTILPTGWSQTIQTVRLTGKQIQDLYKEGYDAVGTGNNYPYVLASPTELLKLEGAECTICENGEEILKTFEKSAPGDYDMILMDVQMPVMNGYEATRAIRRSSHELAKKIPIIAMTANAFSEDIQHSLAAGMNAHISKPVEMKVLEKTDRKSVV